MPVTPFITREVQPTNALRGSNVTLTCIATTSSQSPVEVEWIKDNKVAYSDRNKLLTKKCSRPEMCEIYKCDLFDFHEIHQFCERLIRGWNKQILIC